jgi:hypothetical protein
MKEIGNGFYCWAWEKLPDGTKKENPIHKKWCAMKARCNNPNNDRYKYYGGKGIKVCKEWNDNFQVFAKWALENGYADGLSIDRIDSNKDYCPENCRFIPVRENTGLAHKSQIFTDEQRKNLSEKIKLFNANNPNPNAKKVRCIETGVIFNSVKEASLSLGLNKCAVQCSTKRGYRCGGYHWEYINEKVG